MINCEEKYCYGCSACESICPVNAISMVKKNGFMYPQIKTDSCIGCDLCSKVCPINNHQLNDVTNDVYVYKNSDIVRNISTSGGFFTALCKYIFKQSGVVYGAVFDEQFVVKHARAVHMNDVKKMQGSKYVQSNIREIYTAIKNDLNNGRIVLFSGTPCQNAAVLNYLKINCVNKTNLILCDFICHGVPSPEIWEDYLEFLQKKHGAKIKTVNFRSKDKGWHKPELKIEFLNSKIQSLNEGKDAFYQLFYSNCILRESCHHCEFSCKKRIGDFTMADAWGIDNNYPIYDDNKGVSLVLINSKKALLVFQKMSLNNSLMRISFEDISQPHLTSPAKISSKRDMFWKEYQNKGFEYVLRKYGNYSLYRKILKKIKKIIIRTLIICRVRKS